MTVPASSSRTRRRESAAAVCGNRRERDPGHHGSQGGPVSKKRRRRCRCCGQLFTRDPRARSQQYCAEPNCRSASKKASQQRWLAKPENQDYFRGAQHVHRVRAWRAAQPANTLKRAITRQPLQEMIRGQVIEPAQETALLALQETRLHQVLERADRNGVLVGSGLQDSM